MAMARNLRNGVPFATPVFDGATEEQVRMMLDLAFPDDEAARLQLTPAKTQARLYDAAPVKRSSAPSRLASCTI